MAFSILERIVGVETSASTTNDGGWPSLSVSSNGSLGLKLDLVAWVCPGMLSFSILERIVGVETALAQWHLEQDYNFQYPRTDRWG